MDDSLINQPSIQVCFKVSKRFNNLLNEVKPQGYSDEQMGIYRLIKSLFDKGLSYRKITKHLNERGIPTHQGNKWGETGNSVYSVLKRYKEREERHKHKNKKYESMFSKMKVE